MVEKKNKILFYIQMIVLFGVILFVIVASLNHPTVLGFIDNVRSGAFMSGGQSAQDMIRFELEETVEFEDAEECVDFCVGMLGFEEADCRSVCGEVEFCEIEAGTVITDIGDFWDSCFPNWVDVHSWSCEWIFAGEWLSDSDTLGCDRRLFWNNCESVTYQNAGEVCSSIGGTWNCDDGWAGHYLCEG